MSDRHYNKIGEQFAKQHGTTMGQMFGKPCLKANNKAFCAFHNEAMVFKLGQSEVNELREKYIGSVNWDPSGKNRPMKDWLQVPAKFSNDWPELAKRALGYLKAN